MVWGYYNVYYEIVRCSNDLGCQTTDTQRKEEARDSYHLSLSPAAFKATQLAVAAIPILAVLGSFRENFYKKTNACMEY